jgi:uncharacterized protein YaeQ
MTSRAFRCQVRLTVSDLDREVYGERVVVLAQQPDEDDEHVLLRFMLWVMFFDERLEDSQGWTDRAAPDLICRDFGGDVLFWGEAAAPPMKRIVRTLSRNKRARIVVLFVDEEEADEFHRNLRAARVREPGRVEIMLMDRVFMRRLEIIASRSMRWEATITEGLLYLDCDGELLTGSMLPREQAA